MRKPPKPKKWIPPEQSRVVDRYCKLCGVPLLLEEEADTCDMCGGIVVENK